MDEPRKRRLGKRASLMMAGAAVLIAGIVAFRAQRHERLSRSIKIGMTRSKVEQVLGANPNIVDRGSAYGLLYGSYGDLRLNLIRRFGLSMSRIGFGSISLENWSVRIWIGADDRVIRIERGDEAEGEPLPAFVVPVNRTPAYPPQQPAAHEME